MASLQAHSIKLQFCPNYISSFSRFHRLQCLNFPQKPFSGEVKLVFTCPESYKTKGEEVYSVCCFCKTKDVEIDKVEDKEQDERPPFDINLAVILAGFAFEAYTTPPVINLNLIFKKIYIYICAHVIYLVILCFALWQESVGRKEIDAAGCKTVYLSEYVAIFILVTSLSFTCCLKIFLLSNFMELWLAIFFHAVIHVC